MTVNHSVGGVSPTTQLTYLPTYAVLCCSCSIDGRVGVKSLASNSLRSIRCLPKPPTAFDSIPSGRRVHRCTSSLLFHLSPLLFLSLSPRQPPNCPSYARFRYKCSSTKGKSLFESRTLGCRVGKKWEPCIGSIASGVLQQVSVDIRGMLAVRRCRNAFHHASKYMRSPYVYVPRYHDIYLDTHSLAWNIGRNKIPLLTIIPKTMARSSASAPHISLAQDMARGPYAMAIREMKNANHFRPTGIDQMARSSALRNPKNVAIDMTIALLLK